MVGRLRVPKRFARPPNPAPFATTVTSKRRRGGSPEGGGTRPEGFQGQRRERSSTPTAGSPCRRVLSGPSRLPRPRTQVSDACRSGRTSQASCCQPLAELSEPLADPMVPPDAPHGHRHCRAEGAAAGWCCAAGELHIPFELWRARTSPQRVASLVELRTCLSLCVPVRCRALVPLVVVAARPGHWVAGAWPEVGCGRSALTGPASGVGTVAWSPGDGFEMVPARLGLLQVLRLVLLFKHVQAAEDEGAFLAAGRI